MSMSMGSKMQLEPGSWMEVLYDVYIGTVVGVGHSVKIGWRFVFQTFFASSLRRLGFQIESVDKVIKSDGEKGLKVVAVGYGRTGTYSLALALNELGYPTLHTMEMYENQEIFDMWNNNVFIPAIESEEISMGKPDLKLIAEKGYKATADLPMALYYEQVLEAFPDCKFVLTTRDSSEVWFRSWDTLTKSIVQPTHVGSFIRDVKQYSNYLRWLFSITNKDPSYLTVAPPLPDQNKAASIAGYEEHNRRVRSIIPQDRLLEYNVKQGWEPLCNFLEVGNCPQTPFPKTNSALTVQVNAISSFIVPFSIVLFIVFYGVAKAFQQITGKTVIQWSAKQSRRSGNYLRRFFRGEIYVTGKPLYKQA